MERGWLGGLSDGTPCGRGSTMANTKAVRDWLPKIAAKYGIRSVNDAGAGDMHWIRHVDWDVEYAGYDLIPRHQDVKQWDIAINPLPKADAILCRFVIGHLDPLNAAAAIGNFRMSGSTYLIASNPTNPDPASDLYGTFNKWDLRAAPFDLGAPLESIYDTTEHNICLWKL